MEAETLASEFLVGLRQLGVQNTFVVVPTHCIAMPALEEYWGSLYQADTLKYRWSNIKDPAVEQIATYVKNTDHCYNVVDVDTGYIVADFALCNFLGKAAQVHFSMRPGQSSALSVFLADEVTNTILHHWKDIVNLEESFIETLFGLTPVDNRVACIFIRKAGFKAVGTLGSGASYINGTCDALLTTKSRKV